MAVAQRQVIDWLLGRLRIHAVSAVQYRRVLADDEDDRSFLADADASHVPAFGEGLLALAGEQRGRYAARVEDLAGQLRARIDAALGVNAARWQTDDRAAEEAEKLRAEFDEFLGPLRREYDARQGGFREFLRETVPARIEKLVGDARTTAAAEIRRYLADLAGAHWATLRAAVGRGGMYVGDRRVDLPQDFALRFEEPIAEIWGKQILKLLRARTKEFAGDAVQLVEIVVAWAVAQDTRVRPALILAQREAIKADAKKLETVGREKVADLRTEVKNQLVRKIEAPIRDRCTEFVLKNHHRGTGVKNRILELFAELADEVVRAASGPTTAVLTAEFRAVEREILEVFERHADPLTAARDAIVDSEEHRMRRSDAQKRRRVLAEIDRARAAAPSPTAE